MLLRNCPTCNKNLSYKNKTTLNSATKRNTKCYKCAFSARTTMSHDERKARQKLATSKNKLKLQTHVWEYLSNNPCIDCGESSIIFLEFDHIGPKTEWVSFLIRKHASISKIRAEISKCVVRCISCHRKSTQSKYKSRTQSKQTAYVQNCLQNSTCTVCGDADYRNLEFDHVRGDKLANVSSLVGGRYSIQKIQEEIDKCDIICCKCHKIRTATRGNWNILQYMGINGKPTSP